MTPALPRFCPLEAKHRLAGSALAGMARCAPGPLTSLLFIVALGHHGRSGLGVVWPYWCFGGRHQGGEPDKALRPAGLTLSFWRAARTYAGMIRPSAGLSPTIGPL
jgi:hypothetical protein